MVAIYHSRRGGWLARVTGTVACALAGLTMVCIAPARAQDALLSCAAVADVDQQAAIAAAEGWLKARWAQGGQAWVTAYLVPPAKAAPLGLGRIMALDEPKLIDGASPPVTGVATAHRMTCTSGPGAEAGTFVVHFTAHGLRFNEGQTWSRPLEPVLAHALAVTRSDARTGWRVADIPDAPTALMPGVRLSHPVAADIALLQKPKTAKAASSDRPAKSRP